MKTTKLKFHCFKESGKWYASDEIEVEDKYYDPKDLYELIEKNQKCVLGIKEFRIVIYEFESDKWNNLRCFEPNPVFKEYVPLKFNPDFPIDIKL